MQKNVEKEEILSDLDAQAKSLGIELETDVVGIQSNIDNDEPAEAPVEKTEQSEESSLESDDQEENKTAPPTPEEPPRENKHALRRVHEQKSKVDSLRDEVNSKIDRLATLVEKALTARTPEEQAKAKDKYEEYAEKHNIQVDQVKELAQIIQEDALSKIPKVEAKEEPKSKVIDLNDPAEKAHFDSEFDTFSNALLAEYPNATFSQVKTLKDKLYDIAHQKENVESDLHSIFLRTKDLQDIFFTPKKKSAESGLRKSDREPTPSFVDDLDADIETADDALKAQIELDRMIDSTPIILRRGGKDVQIRNR